MNIEEITARPQLSQHVITLDGEWQITFYDDDDDDGRRLRVYFIIEYIASYGLTDVACGEITFDGCMYFEFDGICHICGNRDATILASVYKYAEQYLDELQNKW